MNSNKRSLNLCFSVDVTNSTKSKHTLVGTTYVWPSFFTHFYLRFTELAEKIEGIKNVGPRNDYFLAIIVAPILETLIFQYGIFKIYQKIKAVTHKFHWFMWTSAILFGLSHFYSLVYIIFGIAEGFLFGYIYYFYHKNPEKAFWTTALVHCLHNSTSVLLLHFNVIAK